MNVSPFLSTKNVILSIAPTTFGSDFVEILVDEIIGQMVDQFTQGVDLDDDYSFFLNLSLFETTFLALLSVVVVCRQSCAISISLKQLHYFLRFVIIFIVDRLHCNLE